MVKVVISGLPKNVKIPKFLSYLENSVFKNPIRVRLLNTRYNGDCKTIKFAMRSNDARAVRRFLNDLEYPYAGKTFPIKCWTDETDEDDNQPETEETNYNQTTFVDSAAGDTFFNNLEDLDNSSPSMLRSEIESIDLKIELIRKQRILMEEENKLLLEQKKSEMLKNIGPNDIENLAKIEKAWGRKYELQDSAPAATFPARKKNNNKWFNYEASSKAILKDMKDIINEYKKVDDSNIVMSLTYSTLRKRLVTILQGKDHLPAPEIVELYRAQYPQSTDRVFLEDLINTITRNCCPTKISEDQNKNSGDGPSETNNINADVKSEANNMKDLKEDNDLIIIDPETVKEQEIKEEPNVPDEKKIVEDLDNEDELLTNIDKDFDDWLENDKDDVKDEKESEEQNGDCAV